MAVTPAFAESVVQIPPLVQIVPRPGNLRSKSIDAFCTYIQGKRSGASCIDQTSIQDVIERRIVVYIMILNAKQWAVKRTLSSLPVFHELPA
jgi:hypothetical protein